MEGYFHQKIKVVLMDVIGSKCVWKSRCDWSTHSAASWESYSIFTCELVWKISGLNLVWNLSYMKFFIHKIGVNFLSGMINLVPHVKFLICIHFKHVSGVNQVWNRPDLMRIFCTGVSQMLVDNCYALSLLLQHSTLKEKFFGEGAPHWRIMALLWICP